MAAHLPARAASRRNDSGGEACAPHQHEGEGTNMLTKLTIGGVVAVAVMLAASHAVRVSAQYPPPEGNCVISTSAATTDPHGNVGVSVTVLDINGKPVPGVPASMSISRQPGSGAALTADRSATDGSGVVTGALAAGANAGVIGISARTAVVSCAASVVVGEGAVLAAVGLPDTGVGVGADGDSPATLAAFLLGTLGMVLAASALRLRRGPRA